MRIAFISDIHVGPTAFHNGVRRKLTEYSEERIRAFTTHVSASRKYEFVVQCGDLIQDSDRKTDLENLNRSLELLKECSVPVYHLIGNHDTVNITTEEVQLLLGYDSLFYAIDVQDFHFVFLYSHVPQPKHPPIILPSTELLWLETDLRKTNKPTIVFVHHSLADQDLTGNPWFEGKPEECLIENRTQAREILSQSKKVVAVINGHLHWNRVHHHDGIPYITVQSAIENFQNDGMPANAWGEIRLQPDIFTIEVFGNDPMKYTYNFKTCAVLDPGNR